MGPGVGEGNGRTCVRPLPQTPAHSAQRNITVVGQHQCTRIAGRCFNPCRPHTFATRTYYTPGRGEL